MAGKIIMWAVSFGCALLFFGIGQYAQKREKPMWFWSGTTVNENEIKNVEEYNKENASLWKRYSLWYFAVGIAEFFSPVLAVVLLLCACSVGSAALVVSYMKIYKKYQKK